MLICFYTWSSTPEVPFAWGSVAARRGSSVAPSASRRVSGPVAGVTCVRATCGIPSSPHHTAPLSALSFSSLVGLVSLSCGCLRDAHKACSAVQKVGWVVLARVTPHAVPLILGKRPFVCPGARRVAEYTPRPPCICLIYASVKHLLHSYHQVCPTSLPSHCFVCHEQCSIPWWVCRPWPA